jgi:hypothetical protein
VFWRYLHGANHDFVSSTPGKDHGASGNIHFCSATLDGVGANNGYFGAPGEACFDNGHNGGKCGYSTVHGLDTYGTGDVHNGSCGMYFMWCNGGNPRADGGGSRDYTAPAGFLWVRAL